MPKFTSDTFLKTGKRRHPDSGSTKRVEPKKDEILKTCIVDDPSEEAADGPGLYPSPGKILKTDPKLVDIQTLHEKS